MEGMRSKFMLKIGITCYPTVGGSGVIATELGKLLAQRGHEVHFITSSLPFRLDRIHPKIFFHEVELNNYPVFQYPPYDLALAAKMAGVIDREKLDVIHVHYAMPHAISAILARDIAENPVKVVTTLHGTDISVLSFDPTFKKMIKYGIERSDVVTAVSHSLAKQTRESLKINKEISVIHNFVNEKVYFKRDQTPLKKHYGITEDEKVIIHISNFRKVKRINDIVKTFHLIQQEIKAKLLLVGDGPECAAIYEQVKSLQLEDQVLFLGKQKKISELLSISDLKLLLSDKESFGLVLLEAMACGVPCIGTNIGGIPEVIKHGKTGYLVGLSDVKRASEYALQLLSDDDLHLQFSQEALKRVQQSFNSKHIVDQYIARYKNG